MIFWTNYTLSGARAIRGFDAQEHFIDLDTCIAGMAAGREASQVLTPEGITTGQPTPQQEMEYDKGVVQMINEARRAVDKWHFVISEGDLGLNVAPKPIYTSTQRRVLSLSNDAYVGDQLYVRRGLVEGQLVKVDTETGAEEVLLEEREIWGAEWEPSIFDQD